MRRLRAKQASEATVAEIKTLRAPENPNRKPRRHKVQGRNDNKLGKAPLAEQKVRLRGGFTASIRWKAANQHLIADDAGGQEGDLYFNYWGPAEAADAEHFEAVQTALRAAREAEDLARRAKEATGAVSVAKGSRDEEYAIIVANVTRHQAELAAFVAKQTAKHAAEREETAEAVRAELRVVVERDPLYWVEGRKDVGLYGKLRALVRSPCRICQARHSLSDCPLLFKTVDCEDKHVPRAVRALFRDKVALDKNFREAISYIRSNFMVSKGELGEVIPLAHDITSNAPVSAISESSMPYGCLHRSKPDVVSSTECAHIQVQSICRSLIHVWFSEALSLKAKSAAPHSLELRVTGSSMRATVRTNLVLCLNPFPEHFYDLIMLLVTVEKPLTYHRYYQGRRWHAHRHLLAYKCAERYFHRSGFSARNSKDPVLHRSLGKRGKGTDE
jgi:hypothetical protein